MGRIDAVGLPQAASSGLIRPGKNPYRDAADSGKGKKRSSELTSLCSAASQDRHERKIENGEEGPEKSRQSSCIF